MLTDKSLQEIKTQVVDKLKTEGKSLWANFHDGKGNYVCGNVDVVFNGKPYATIKVGDGNTTPEGSKSCIAKELGTAISKEIYKQMKEQGAKEGYTSQLKFTIGVNMNFGSSANSEIAAKTAKYAKDYQVTVVANLNSNGLLEYKYDEGNYLRLNITQKIQRLITTASTRSPNSTPIPTAPRIRSSLRPRSKWRRISPRSIRRSRRL